MPKVLYIGFGISPATLGGAIIYQESLARKMRDRGWEVVCFFGARSDCNIKIQNKPYLKRRYKNGIKFIELYNTPNEAGYFGDPARQCRDPYIDILTKRVLDEERPDIVHIQELQMHAASIIDIVCEAGYPVLKTMHNYFDICPQRDLMFQGRQLCLDFDHGQRCVDCLTVLPVKMVAPLANRILRNFLPPRLYGYLSTLYKAHSPNITGQKTCRTYRPDQYAERRRFFVEKLNKLDIIHCSSRRSAEILAGYGVLKNRIKIIPLSVKSIEDIVPKPLRDNHYPVVFGYAGAKHLSRGYQVLMDAFAKLDQKKAKLIMWGPAGLRSPDASLNIEARPRYDIAGINRAFEEIDVGIIPSIWEEIFGIVGIEWLAARIPVIGSNIGGIPDWLEDGETGFLVPAGDRDALAEKMRSFVNNPELIAELQKKIKRQKTLDEHVDELLGLYRDMCAKKKANV